MLPPYIIEKLKERELEREREEQPQLELELELPRPHSPRTEPAEEERGVVIIPLWE